MVARNWGDTALILPPVCNGLAVRDDRIEVAPVVLPPPSLCRTGAVCRYVRLCNDRRKALTTIGASRACIGAKCSATRTRLQERLNIFRNALVDLQVSLGWDAFVPPTQGHGVFATIAVGVR